MEVTAGGRRRVLCVVCSGDPVPRDVAQDIGKDLADLGQHALVLGTACFQRHSFRHILFQVENQGRLMIPRRPHTPVAGSGSA